MKLVRGVGINNKTRPASGNAYKAWLEIIDRCKSDPSYSMSNTFKNYHLFYEWYNSMVGAEDGYNFSSNLLCKNNKTFSRSMCLLIPPRISRALNMVKARRSDLPMGVGKVGNNFLARISIDGERIHLGVYPTVDEAFQAYKEAREEYLKQLAEKYKDSIDERAYYSLVNWKVEITD